MVIKELFYKKSTSLGMIFKTAVVATLTFNACSRGKVSKRKKRKVK